MHHRRHVRIRTVHAAITTTAILRIPAPAFRLMAATAIVAAVTAAADTAAADIRDDFDQSDIGEHVSITKTTMNLQEQFGQIDIYVFDQILRGNIGQGMRIFDAGCGYGRNLVHLLREGCEVFAVDQNAEGVEHVQALAAQLAPDLPASNFRVGQLDQINFPDKFADVVICSSVLHFARDDAHFLSIIDELWRVLRPGGLLFCRLGSRIGMDFKCLRRNIFRINDGSEWFLVDEAMLMQLTQQLDAVMVDPLKTTIVQNHRCMTTWVLRKRSIGPRRGGV
jgi:SAM-dependent methyltransferase